MARKGLKIRLAIKYIEKELALCKESGCCEDEWEARDKLVEEAINELLAFTEPDDWKGLEEGDD